MLIKKETYTYNEVITIQNWIFEPRLASVQVFISLKSESSNSKCTLKIKAK